MLRQQDSPKQLHLLPSGRAQAREQPIKSLPSTDGTGSLLTSLENRPESRRWIHKPAVKIGELKSRLSTGFCWLFQSEHIPGEKQPSTVVCRKHINSSRAETQVEEKEEEEEEDCSVV